MLHPIRRVLLALCLVLGFLAPVAITATSSAEDLKQTSVRLSVVGGDHVGDTYDVIATP